MVGLRIGKDVQRLLEERSIRSEDLRSVIEFAEKTGSKFYNKVTGHHLSHRKLGNVTFWVEYSPQGSEFLVHKAYSHRMEIAEGIEP